MKALILPVTSLVASITTMANVAMILHPLRSHPLVLAMIEILNNKNNNTYRKILR
jgi:hypothetical protein